MKQEEKLQEAKRLYKTANVDQRYVLESLFPELAESEDARIRKEIISALKWANHKGVYDKHIDWLEKQGEQKPTDEDMKEALRTEYEKGRADAIAEMQKSAWSEEDEAWLKESELIICFFTNDESCRNEYLNWLKSLKDRVQPKVELTIKAQKGE